MDKHYFIKLLHKYLKGEGTIEELQFLERYYELFQNEPDVWDTLGPETKQQFKTEIKDAIWKRISNEEQPDRKVRALSSRFIRIAAASLIIVISVMGLAFYFNSRKPALVAVVKQNENRVISLPDGSTVILSPDSKLNYPSSFDGLATREVFLEGQAFFDVKYNVSRPFIVHTGKISTKVLGTTFNIKAMPGEKDIVVTVKSGKVKVSDEDKTLGIIIPNQQISYNKEKISADLKTVNSDSYLEWKEQNLLFDNLTIAEAAMLLEEKYKVKIVVEDTFISSKRFTTTFTKNENFEETLKSICLFNELKYKYDKEKAIVIIY